MCGRVSAVVLLAVAPAVAQSGFPWWKDPKVVQELALTPEQSARIDAIFQATRPQLRQFKEELDRQEAEVSRLLEANADEATVVRQVDKVEAVRAQLNKARTVMALHMRQVLTPRQNARFNAVFEQYRRDNPLPSPDGRGGDSRTRTPSR
jgi:Spy/CpxP family protein refolding chaperone